jgi:hypothetical protein
VGDRSAPARNALTIVDPKSGAKAVIDGVMSAEAIHTALRTESTGAQIPLAIYLVANDSGSRRRS